MEAIPRLHLGSKASEPRQFGLPGDRFQLVDRLSHGGQGEVHSCRRLNNGDDFAVKIIDRRVLSSHPRHEVLLRREIRTLRELQHRNVVSLHDAFWEEGSCFIVMDLAREGDLRQKIVREVGLGGDPAFTEHCSRFISSQLVSGIGHMHQRRVIHRDLKAENILVTRSVPVQGSSTARLCDVKITDFGLSTWLDIVGELLTPCGTPNYLAPEIAKDNYDERIDFWSFGVVLYIMLCGDFPFDQYHNPCDVENILHQSIKGGGSWQRVSEAGRSFVCGLLVFDPDIRLCHGRCFAHPWLAEFRAQQQALAAMPDALRPTSGGVPESSDAGALLQIGGWTGAAVDSVSLKLRDGSVESHGGIGGWKQQEYSIQPHEVIIAVSQETRSLLPSFVGNQIVFYTSLCQVAVFQGEDARRRNRLVAPAGSQIVGLQFVRSQIQGIILEDIRPGCPGSVAQIYGSTGYAVDEVIFGLRSGATRSYGSRGGIQQGALVLQEDEYIAVVEQGRRDEFLGNSIAFFTTAGRVYKLAGMAASESRRFAAPPGAQVCGLNFEEGVLVGVSTCPRNVCRPQPCQVSLDSVAV